jgi:hypothetical protein
MMLEGNYLALPDLYCSLERKWLTSQPVIEIQNNNARRKRGSNEERKMEREGERKRKSVSWKQKYCA